jgi:hypothetical protein
VTGRPQYRRRRDHRRVPRHESRNAGRRLDGHCAAAHSAAQSHTVRTVSSASSSTRRGILVIAGGRFGFRTLRDVHQLRSSSHQTPGQSVSNRPAPPSQSHSVRTRNGRAERGRLRLTEDGFNSAANDSSEALIPNTHCTYATAPVRAHSSQSPVTTTVQQCNRAGARGVAYSAKGGEVLVSGRVVPAVIRQQFAHALCGPWRSSKGVEQLLRAPISHIESLPVEQRHAPVRLRLILLNRLCACIRHRSHASARQQQWR